MLHLFTKNCQNRTLHGRLSALLECVFMNKSTHDWKIGLSLSLLVVFFWSTLPVALDMSLKVMDAWTLTWLRFFVAAVLTAFIIFFNGSWRAYAQLSIKQWLWLLLAGAMLIANYLFFQFGLSKTTPANAQVLIQLAPLLMILGGVVIFKERFYLKQKVGALLLICGLLLFFNDQINVILSPEYRLGVILIIVAAVTWAIYALIQKHMQSLLSPQAILTVIYLIAVVALWPFAQLTDQQNIDTHQWLAIGYAALNTVGAYGAFAQALKYWQASRVGMVIAMVPVFTLLFVNMMHQLLPNLVQAENINGIGLAGIVFIVCGSVIASLGQK